MTGARCFRKEWGIESSLWPYGWVSIMVDAGSRRGGALSNWSIVAVWSCGLPVLEVRSRLYGCDWLSGVRSPGCLSTRHWGGFELFCLEWGCSVKSGCSCWSWQVVKVVTSVARFAELWLEWSYFAIWRILMWFIYDCKSSLHHVSRLIRLLFTGELASLKDSVFGSMGW